MAQGPNLYTKKAVFESTCAFVLLTMTLITKIGDYYIVQRKNEIR